MKWSPSLVIFFVKDLSFHIFKVDNTRLAGGVYG